MLFLDNAKLLITLSRSKYKYDRKYPSKIFENVYPVQTKYVGRQKKCFVRVRG